MLKRLTVESSAASRQIVSLACLIFLSVNNKQYNPKHKAKKKKKKATPIKTGAIIERGGKKEPRGQKERKRERTKQGKTLR